MKVFVTGATGLVGRALVEALVATKNEVTALSRHRSPTFPREVQVVTGDPTRPGPWQEALSQKDACVHLAGDPIAQGRWTPEKKRRIRESRTVSTSLVAEVVRAEGPRVLVSGSAVGYYGDRGDEVLTESSPKGKGYLSDVCAAWEEAAVAARVRARVVLLRTGVVLSKKGGAFPRLALPFKFFLGGPLGTGSQWVPFIHLSDEIALILKALDDERVSGPLNAVGPAPSRNRDLTRALGRALGRPSFLSAPEFALRAVIGDKAEIVLASQRAIPKKAEDLGFRFRFRNADEVLSDLI